MVMVMVMMEVWNSTGRSRKDGIRLLFNVCVSILFSTTVKAVVMNIPLFPATKAIFLE